MAVKIRLAKVGKKNAPTYRVVVAKERSKRNGKFLDILGFFNPQLEFDSTKIDKDLLAKWVHNGAQISEAVKKLLDGKNDFKKYNPKKIQEENLAAKEV